jgi:hypothetical protein
MSVGIGPFRFYSGAFAAIGGLVAAGMLIQYWQVFAFVALGIVVLHCLVRKPKAPIRTDADREGDRAFIAELAADMARRH